MEIYQDECQVFTDSEDTLWLYPQKPAPTETFLTEMSGKTLVIKPQLIEQPGFIWQFIALILAIFIFAYIKLVRKNFFKNLRAAFSSRPLFRQMLRDDMLFPAGIYVPVFIAIALTFSVLLLQLDEMLLSFSFFSKIEELKNLLLYFAAASVFMLAKYLLHFITGVIFGTRQLTKEYLNNAFYFNTIAAIVFIPLLMIATFTKSETVLLVIIGIALIMVILRIFRGLLISLEMEKYSQFQNFLYFCTLEILPFLTIYKLIMEGII
jgi:hypothetical protein